jgi:glutamate-1-semialdehyde 2,1-aminomutase
MCGLSFVGPPLHMVFETLQGNRSDSVAATGAAVHLAEKRRMQFMISYQSLQRAVRTDAWAATRNAIREIDAANAFYPQYVERASGAYLWDVDGNRYIDFILGYGPVVLGHADPRVNEAVFNELRNGSCMSPMWSRRQATLTELLTEVIPGAEQAYLMKTGSDATAAAVRLARIHTGRDKVLKWGYNGWHDWTAPRPDGVPASTRGETLQFRYNDLGSVEEAFSRYPGQIACVIMMPYELETAHDGFLEGVKRIAHRNGALFILDEMRSGFRMALGGAQEYFQVRADLSTFSKAMANGFPISAVIGSADLLKGLRRTHMSSTFYANPAEMAAAIVTISILRDSGALERIWRLSESFQEGLRGIVREFGAPADVIGYPISPFLSFRNGDGPEVQTMRTRFFHETVSRGLMLHPNHQWFLSAAHTEDDIAAALEICRSSFAAAVGL